MKKPKRTWRWVSRDNDPFKDHTIQIWPLCEKPHKSFHYFDEDKFIWQGVQYSMEICDKEFKKLFGFLPKPGELMKVEFKARRVK